MSKIKPGDRVRVVQDLYANLSPVGDLIGREGTVSATGVPLWPGHCTGETGPTWVRVNLAGLIEIFHPDELEVIEP